MQEMYGKAQHLATSDSLTGLYNHGFLHAHLARQIADAEARKRPLTLCMFALPEMRDINRAFGYAAGDQILRQVGSLIGGLVRGEDLTARCAGTKFCVVMPDTPSQEADVVRRRIDGVVANTSFGSVQMDEPVHIHLKSGQVSLEHGSETAEDLIARARKSLA
jgi:two-component system cell cycle response regulator